MTLNQLRYFQTLARTEHYHRAAELLYISQPSLSRAIAQLETELGVCLFERQGRNVALTEAGAVFLRQVDEILALLDAAVEDLKNFSAPEEQISIGCILPALLPYVSPLLRKYQSSLAYPLRCQTNTGVSEELLAGLLSGLYDVVFCSHVENMKNVKFTSVWKLPFYVAVRRDSPLAALSEIHPEDLRETRMLFTRTTTYSGLIRQMLESYGVKPLVAGYSNEETGLIGMVEAGLGVFITTDYPQIHSENTVLIPLAQHRFTRTICLAVRADREPTPAVTRFIRFIQETPDPCGT